MKKLLTLVVIVVACLALGASVAYAKDNKKKTESIEYSLSPAPHCQNCVNKIQSNLRFEKGVKEVNVDLEKKTVTIAFLPKDTNSEKLAEALKKIGYTATPFDASTKAECQSCDGGDSCCKGKDK